MMRRSDGRSADRRGELNRPRETLLEIADYRLAFDSFDGTAQVLDGVSLQLAAGETLGIVGESGSGKSTLARCVIRLLDPDQGEVWAQGGANDCPRMLEHGIAARPETRVGTRIKARCT